MDATGGQRDAPAASPGERDQVPIAQEAGYALRPFWTGAENLATMGFDTRTVQPVASCYNDYANPAHHPDIYKR